ncbi:MAG: hypothetical protein EZS28_005476 [Streblomastix strix]|uniref:Protein kinase domain-containing protein n=1 Tax=Streblomastix strix TaxID=222440 RepID=A0A5J4WVM1_9EUKA|nr:MAG: hypothetical protein EZS28_005476 [Streblomastix strix]
MYRTSPKENPFPARIKYGIFLHKWWKRFTVFMRWTQSTEILSQEIVQFSPELLEEEEDESDSGSDNDFNKIHKRSATFVIQTQESDIFALGEICYELIVLKHPFTGKQGRITNKRIKKCTPKQLPSRISEQLKQIVMAMLNKDHVRRSTTGQLISQNSMLTFAINFFENGIVHYIQ